MSGYYLGRAFLAHPKRALGAVRYHLLQGGE